MKARIDTIKTFNISNIHSTKGRVATEFDLYKLENFLKDFEHLKVSHRHDFYCFFVVTNGIGSQTIDMKEYRIFKGRVFFINYGQVHSWNKILNVKGYAILFTEGYYNLIYSNNSNIQSDKAFSQIQNYVDLERDEITYWKQWLNLMEKENNSGTPFSEELICLLLKCMVLLFRRKGTEISVSENKSLKKSETFQKFLRLINHEYKTKKTPSDYASILNITANYLNSISKEISGQPSGFWIKKRVILEAKRLLTHSNGNILEISSMLGFEDNSYFCKYFKKIVGQSPEKFRRNFKETNQIRQSK